MITGDTALTVTSIIAFVTVACTLYNTFYGKRKYEQSDVEHRIKEATSRAEEMTKIETKLDQISYDVRFIKDDVTKTKNELHELDTKVALLDASIRSAHKRMDGAGIGRIDSDK